MDALTELAANLRRHILTTVTDPFIRELELLTLDIEINRARCSASLEYAGPVEPEAVSQAPMQKAEQICGLMF